jgi:hypothetical protein
VQALIIETHTVLQPSANVVAATPPGGEYFSVTSTTAQITCPTGATRLLPVHVPSAKKGLSTLDGKTVHRIAQTEPRVVNRTVAGEIFSSRTNRYVARGGAAGKGLTVAPMKLL